MKMYEIDSNFSFNTTEPQESYILLTSSTSSKNTLLEFNQDDFEAVTKKVVELINKHHFRKALYLSSNEDIQKINQELLNETEINISGNLVKKIEEVLVKPFKNKILYIGDDIIQKRVLIIDDSKVIIKVLRSTLESLSISGMQVFYTSNEKNVIKFAKRMDFDLFTLDINMPQLSGVEILKLCKSNQISIPTLVITSLNKNDSGPVFEALSLGAYDYLKKPDQTNKDAFKTELKNKVEAGFTLKTGKKNVILEYVEKYKSLKKNSLILLGASTGGTESIKKFLKTLPDNIPPIVIVQHIPPVFSTAFANHLNDQFKFNILELTQETELEDNSVYIAPGSHHMKLKQVDNKIFAYIEDGAKVSGHKPSVDVLFKSALNIDSSINKVAILLTGMGKDGAEGMLSLKNTNCYNIVQDQESSVVYGMPKRAFELNAHHVQTSLGKIGVELCRYLSKGTEKMAG